MVKVKKISAGSAHLVGISVNDTLVGWGTNNFGQLEFPPNIIKVKDIFAEWHG
jgi:alpha-tubulin suppressor-like RCC1 family protein